MESRNYTTISGDRWDSLAVRFYGNLKSISILTDANMNVPLSPVLDAGTRLIIPIIDDSNENVITENLPPWKR